MKYSTKSRYALRMMVQLAGYTHGEYVPLKAISEQQHISLKYLEQIVTPLVRARLLQSGRGSQGGYRLIKLPQDYTAGEIICAVEGSIAPIPCLDGPVDDCPQHGCCSTRRFWEGLEKTVNGYMSSVTLADLYAEQPGVNDYII